MSKQVKLDAFAKEISGSTKDEVNLVKPLDLPKQWKCIKLKAVANIIMGQSPPSTTYNKERRGLPFYQGKADFGEKYPTPRVWCSEPYKVAESGDILISVRAPVGPVNICQEKACIGRGLAAIRPQTSFLDNMFLFYYLRSIESKWLGRGSTFKAIKKKDLEDLLVPLPPLDEQKRIVSRLEQLIGRVEKAKRLRKAANEETEKIMQAALNEIFSRVQEKGWEWKKLRELTWINREKRNPAVEMPNEEFIYIDISSVESGTGRILNVKKILGKDAPSRARRVVHTNDIIMSTVRPYLRSFAIIPQKYDNQICSTGFAVLSCRQDILPKYLLYALFSDTVIQQCNEMMIGAHYPALRIDQVARIKIPVPPLKQQKRIAEYFDQMIEAVNSLKELQRKTEEELQNLVPSILDKAFKGEL